MIALIIPCYIKSQWDIDCLQRLFDSVHSQKKQFDKVYLIDDACPLTYELRHNFVEHIILKENGGPAKARNVGIDKALALGIQHLLFTDHDCILDNDWNEQMTSFLDQTDFATVQSDMTCAEAIEKVRSDAPTKKTVYYVYVVDGNQKLQGFITLKDLIMAEPNTKVEHVLHKDFVFAYVDEDREKVAFIIEKYDLVAIPILNRENQLVGIVTHDEAIEVIRAEHSEDMQKFRGITQANEAFDYIGTSTFKHFKKRVVWIVSLAAVGIISGVIIHSYENALEKLLILALYMPMVADTEGNSGSQAATVVVRALALGQITVSNWFKNLWKEAKISLLLAVCLGLLAYVKVLFLSWETDIPSAYSLPLIAFMISIALALQVITATVIGAGLPLLVKRFGGDPAVAASPAITTVVDITELLIYFGMATLLFSL